MQALLPADSPGKAADRNNGHQQLMPICFINFQICAQHILHAAA
jgi:hypothetical protein